MSQADLMWLGDELREMRKRAEDDRRWRDVAVISAVYTCGVLRVDASPASAAPVSPPAEAPRVKRGRKPRADADAGAPGGDPPADQFGNQTLSPAEAAERFGPDAPAPGSAVADEGGGSAP